MWSDNSPRFKRYLFCICEAGICDLRPLKNDPDRFFYKCLTPNCKQGKNHLFKYEHEVDENDVFIDVPNCGECKGGRCRVARDKGDGPNAGKIVFTCTLKKEQGACNYKVYQDELLVTLQVGPGSTLDQIASNGYDDISDADIIDSVISNEINERGLNYESPEMNTPIHLRRCESSWKMTQLKRQDMELGESSMSTAHRKRSRDGEYEGIATLYNSPTSMHTENTTNSGRSTPVTKTPLRPENLISLKEHDQNHVNGVASPNIMSNLPEIRSCSRSPIDRSTNSKIQRINPNVPSQPDSFISEMSNAYGQAAKVLQSELVTLLMTMEAKDHESMHHEAKEVFSALDGMKINYQQFKEQIMNLIDSAKSLREKEESIPENDYAQKLVFNRYSSERKKLEEINSAHAKAVDTVENTRNCVEVIKEEISLAKDRLVPAEADLLLSEAALEKICNEKEFLTRKCNAGCQEYQDCMDLQGVVEAEYDIAKDAIEKARKSLG